LHFLIFFTIFLGRDNICLGSKINKNKTNDDDDDDDDNNETIIIITVVLIIIVIDTP